MKYYKSASGDVYAYESDGSQDAWIKPDLVPMTQAEIDAHLNPLTPEPPSYPQFTALEMLDLFTEAEQLAVVEATMSVPDVKLWYDRLIAAMFVTYEDPRVEAGLQALLDADLLTPERKAEIVAAMQPPAAD